jgi:DUF4097 and DUF4098 domain-containing protein YvlB
MRQPRFYVPLLAVFTFATGVSPLAAQDFEWRGRITAGDEIEIKGVNGDVIAEFTSGSEVVVTAVKRSRRSDPDVVDIEVIEHSGGITICAVYPSGDRPNECASGSRGRMNTRNNDTRVHFTVRVPAGVRFVGRTVNGDVEAIGLESEVEAVTVNGDVEVTTTEQAVANTVNGSIRASIGSTSGGVEFETVNGSITLDLPEESNVDLHASTVNGSIDSALPITVSGRFSRRSLQGRIGDGGTRLDVSTVNGSIRLRRSR